MSCHLSADLGIKKSTQSETVFTYQLFLKCNEIKSHLKKRYLLRMLKKYSIYSNILMLNIPSFLMNHAHNAIIKTKLFNIS